MFAWFSASVLLFTAAAFILTGRIGRDMASETGFPAVPVQVADAGYTDLREVLTLAGATEANRRVPVPARVTGRLEEVFVAEGQPVKTGQALARIGEHEFLEHRREAAAGLDVARAELAAAADFHRRMAALYGEQIITSLEMDGARSRLEAARAAVESFEARVDRAARQLEDTLVSAPVDGFVSRCFFSPGVTVGPGSGSVFEISDLDPVRVRMPVDPLRSSAILVEQLVEVTAEAFPGQSFSGRVVSVAPGAGANSRGPEVEILVANPDFRLGAGVLVRAVIPVAFRPGVTAVPERALLRAGGRAVAYVVEAGRAHRRDVVTGLEADGLVEVVAGLEPGDRVVVGGLADIVEGTAVLETGRNRFPARPACPARARMLK